ncbi:hypothetical protein ODI_R3011 [Orrella dioscoreae]|uniref:SH3 domain-containing protein n=1 Tax=Orrella dioscoreae TaxID=1851544 RepID=A0A1C3K0R0_9BURK|nr:hypothetical protein ODI_01897 [Orrella dioscoreae]SOE50843.1 hypothetical protein ODI_R3011 [Orrella dioscoreae]
MLFLVLRPHRSDHPDPIAFTAGTQLRVGETHEGPEGWDNWHFCQTDTHAGGWVPGQIIVRDGDGLGTALEDYTARELDVLPGDILQGNRMLNGWVWCLRAADERSGWVPCSVLRQARMD